MGIFRVLITGSREWNNPDLMASRLQQARQSAEGKDMVIVHGGARGADSMAGRMAKAAPNASEEVHVPLWRTEIGYNAYAGHVRNQEMVDAGADVCLAFYQLGAANRGTRDCVKRARRKGIPVVEVWSNDEI